MATDFVLNIISVKRSWFKSSRDVRHTSLFYRDLYFNLPHTGVVNLAPCNTVYYIGIALPDWLRYSSSVFIFKSKFHEKNGYKVHHQVNILYTVSILS